MYPPAPPEKDNSPLGFGTSGSGAFYLTAVKIKEVSIKKGKTQSTAAGSAPVS